MDAADDSSSANRKDLITTNGSAVSAVLFARQVDVPPCERHFYVLLEQVQKKKASIVCTPGVKALRGFALREVEDARY